MINSIKYLAGILVLIIGCQNAFAQDQITESQGDDSKLECAAPAGPIIPDGNVASEDELVAAQKGIKAYQTNLADYRACLDKMQAALDPEADTNAIDTLDIKAKYDSSIDAETVIAEEFNVAVRAFKARQQ